MQYLPFPTLLSTTGTILLSLQILCKMSLARQLSTWRSLPECSLVLSFISSAVFPGGTFFHTSSVSFCLWDVSLVHHAPSPIPWVGLIRAYLTSRPHLWLCSSHSHSPVDLSCRCTRLMPLRAWPNFSHLKVNLACVCLISWSILITLGHYFLSSTLPLKELIMRLSFF